MMNNGRPLSRAQTVKIMVALTILAWATQTLFHQWGFGQVLSVEDAPAEPKEAFIAGTGATGGATLEVRSEATVVGGEVTLRQICRWSDRDKQLFDPIGDLVLVRLSEQTPFRSLCLQDLRGLLHDAGVNIASIDFAGATGCTVSRSDVNYDEKTALANWANAKQTAPTSMAVDVSSAPSDTLAVVTDPSSPRTLRSLLIAELAQKLSLPIEALQVDFKLSDDNSINCAKPQFSFEIDSTHARSVGSVSWLVAITRQGETRKTMIYADVRAWQDQVVAAKPLAFHQLIREDDVATRRQLVSQLSDDAPLKMNQVVGQMAARDLKPGAVLTGKCVDPLELVKNNQFVSLTLQQGSVSVKTVARALEAGAFGQTIRVKNDQTGETMQVVVTGPQAAALSSNSTVATAEGH